MITSVSGVIGLTDRLWNINNRIDADRERIATLESQVADLILIVEQHDRLIEPEFPDG